jgi:hypothetical protein
VQRHASETCIFPVFNCILHRQVRYEKISPDAPICDEVAVKHLVVCLACFALPASAETSGIRFDEMPVGCRIFATYGSGEQVIDEYVGLSGGNHVMKTYEGPNGRRLIRTTTYSQDGLMLRKDWAGGKWETFAPASCFDVPGECRYTYRNADGAEQVYVGRNTRRGRRLTSEGGFQGEPAFPPTVSTFGPFNNTESYTEGQTSFQVTRYENCGLGS